MMSIKEGLPGLVRIFGFSLAVMLGVSAMSSTSRGVIGFEDLDFVSGDFENGKFLAGTSTTTNDPFGPGSGSLVARESVFAVDSLGSFSNSYSEKFSGLDGGGDFEFSFWSGWSYSRTTDTLTSGLVNQYSAIAGSGVGGSSVYGVAGGVSTEISFLAPFDFSGRGAFLTNTTYAHNSMRDGDTFGKVFGGPAGDDPDFFLLQISGLLGGSQTGTVDFFLADFRSSDPSEDYIVNDWEFVSFDSLGIVDALEFRLSSSDTGRFGMNTPAFFAIDGIGAVPEVSTVPLVIGVLLLFLRRGYRRSRG